MPSYLITDQLNFVGVASDAGLVDDIMHEALLGRTNNSINGIP